MLSLVEQLLLGLLTSLMGDAYLIFFYAAVAYWAGVAIIVIRRPMTPNKTDIMMLKWGFLLLFVISIFMSFQIWRLRGAT